jgi:hypothetical protein
MSNQIQDPTKNLPYDQYGFQGIINLRSWPNYSYLVLHKPIQYTFLVKQPNIFYYNLEGEDLVDNSLSNELGYCSNLRSIPKPRFNTTK